MNAQAAAEAEAEQDDVLISPEDLILNGRYRILRGALLLSYGTSATEAFRVEDDQQGSLDLFALVGDQTLPPRSDEIALLTGFMHRHVMRLVDAGTVPNSGPGSAHHPIILEFPAGGHVMPPQGASAMVENEVKRRIMGPVLMLLTFAGVLAASLEFPTFIILACGMPPALVAGGVGIAIITPALRQGVLFLGREHGKFTNFLKVVVEPTSGCDRRQWSLGHKGVTSWLSRDSALPIGSEAN
jgi:hypothetical protein